jgi:hypothetical protein
MLQGRAIYVPRHGLIERVRTVRFVNRSTEEPVSNGRSNGDGHADRATTIEIWPGNYYGDLDGKMIARQTAADAAEFVFGEAEAPRIEPERSLVALLHNPPERWEIAFESIVDASSERTGAFCVVIDNFGTARDAVANSADQGEVGLAPALAHAT